MGGRGIRDRAWRALGAPIRQFRRSRFAALAPLDRVIEVPIAQIAYRIEDVEFLRRTPPGAIVPHFPDLQRFGGANRLDRKFASIIAHFREGVPWRETPLFSVDYAPRLAERRIRGCATLAELEAYYVATYDPLYERIRREGVAADRFGRGVPPLYVHISEYGEFIWPAEGGHRLAICAALGHRSVPARIHARHRRWQALRDSVAADLAAGRAIDPALARHPDLGDLLRPAGAPAAPVAALPRVRPA